MGKFIDITGNKYSRLEVLEYMGKKDHRSMFKCKCDCGNIVDILASSLKSGNTTSCGCYQLEIRTKHNKSFTPEYRIWAGMKSRCLNKNETQFFNYGGRGIKVCQEWIDSFESFYNDVGPRPTKNHSIDRIDNDKGYHKDNVKWSLPKEQCANRRGWSNSSSSFKGVSWHKKCKKWAANIYISGNHKSLGHYTDERMAALAYNKEAYDQWGDDANLNEITDD